MPDTLRASRLLALAGSLALSACAASPIAPKERATMPTSIAPHAAPDASLLLKSLLELIRQTRHVQDITPDRVSAAMGVELETWGHTRFGFRGQLTPQWSYVGDVDVARQMAPGMEFQFVPAEPGSHPDATAICAFDFDEFARALLEAGFSGGPYFGEHGQVLRHEYRRDALRVEVSAVGPMTASAAQACVTLVVLR